MTESVKVPTVPTTTNGKVADSPGDYCPPDLVADANRVPWEMTDSHPFRDSGAPLRQFAVVSGVVVESTPDLDALMVDPDDEIGLHYETPIVVADDVIASSDARDAEMYAERIAGCR